MHYPHDLWALGLTGIWVLDSGLRILQAFEQNKMLLFSQGLRARSRASMNKIIAVDKLTLCKQQLKDEFTRPSQIDYTIGEA